MKRKVKLVNFDEKDHDAIAMSMKMTPEERMHLMFELIELSQQFQNPSLDIIENNMAEIEGVPFIILKKRNHAVS